MKKIKNKKMIQAFAVILSVIFAVQLIVSLSRIYEIRKNRANNEIVKAKKTMDELGLSNTRKNDEVKLVLVTSTSQKWNWAKLIEFNKKLPKYDLELFGDLDFSNPGIDYSLIEKHYDAASKKDRMVFMRNLISNYASSRDEHEATLNLIGALLSNYDYSDELIVAIYSEILFMFTRGDVSLKRCFSLVIRIDHIFTNGVNIDRDHNLSESLRSDYYVQIIKLQLAKIDDVNEKSTILDLMLSFCGKEYVETEYQVDFDITL